MPLSPATQAARTFTLALLLSIVPHAVGAQGGAVADSASREIRLNPSPSLSGALITLRPEADGRFVGEMETYWDYKRETERASAVGVPMACEG